MILKIAILILLIEIIAGKPGKPKGWPEGKPWPPKNEKPVPKPKPPRENPNKHSPCVCPNGPKNTPGGCFPKKPKGGKRGIWDPPVPGIWDPPVPRVKCQPDPDSPTYPEYPENPDYPDYPGFPEYPGRPYKRIR